MIYIRKATLCMKSTEQTQKLQQKRRKKEKRHKREPSNRLITKEKRAKKRRERITSRDAQV